LMGVVEEKREIERCVDETEGHGDLDERRL
jgi:hypothetical protein